MGGPEGQGTRDQVSWHCHQTCEALHEPVRTGVGAWAQDWALFGYRGEEPCLDCRVLIAGVITVITYGYRLCTRRDFALWRTSDNV